MAVAEIQKGKAKIWGMDGVDFVFGAVAFEATSESADITDSATIEEIKGQNGELEQLISSNRMHTMSVQFSPSGTTRANAITEATKVFTAGPISAVTTSGFHVASYNGDWYLESYSCKFTRDGLAVYTLNLKAPINATARTAVTGAVISG